ncbi:hypothetical protein [Chlamydia vaughanii]|uniref:hypothetical protein n=1 Tax=Chlamydia vaughanii TaxID=3112552 RepID=UPI0032B23FD4
MWSQIFIANMHPYIHAHVVTSLIAFINKVSGHVDSKLLSSNKEHKSQLHDQNSDLKITDHKYFRVNSPLIIAANAGGGVLHLNTSAITSPLIKQHLENASI